MLQRCLQKSCSNKARRCLNWILCANIFQSQFPPNILYRSQGLRASANRLSETNSVICRYNAQCFFIGEYVYIWGGVSCFNDWWDEYGYVTLEHMNQRVGSCWRAKISKSLYRNAVETNFILIRQCTARLGKHSDAQGDFKQLFGDSHVRACRWKCTHWKYFLKRKCLIFVTAVVPRARQFCHF